MPSKSRITSHDVAKMAGVSRTTVSFVLNNVSGVRISEATRQRVLDAARELKYYPDSAGRNLVSGKSYTLGLVIRQTPEQVYSDAFLPQVMLGISQAAALHNYHLLLNPLKPEERKGYARLIHENHVDGILLSGPRTDDQELLDLFENQVPILLLGQLPESQIPVVDINAIQGAVDIVRHLIDLGHRRIAMITNGPLTYTSAEQRRKGYQLALESAGLQYDPHLVKQASFTPASGYSAMQELLKIRSLPSAVFIASDVVAIGALLAVKHAGLNIPRDMAIVGFDDIPLAEYFDPPLTTVRLPAYGLGWASGERLIRLIQGEKLMEHELLLDTELVIRASSTG